MTVAELDMTNNSAQCPDGLSELRHANMRACGSANEGEMCSRGCSSTIFYMKGFQISKVCGRIKAYQLGTPRGFQQGSNDTNSYYVDGVSLTYGNPRQHIWTFAAAAAANSIQCP